MKKLLKEKKAITLIALVITIVVLVILAAVTIAMTVGNDGLIAKAIKAANDYKNAQEKDKQSINDLYGQLVVASDGTISGLTLENLKELMNTQIEEKTADMQSSINSMQGEINTLKAQNTLLMGANTNNFTRTASGWISLTCKYDESKELEIPLAGHQKGIAIVNVVARNRTNTCNQLYVSLTGGTWSGSYSERKNTWVHNSSTFAYNENTKLKFIFLAYGKNGTSNATGNCEIEYYYTILFMPQST